MHAIAFPKHAPLLSSTLVRFLVVGGVSYMINQAALFGLYDGFMRSLAPTRLRPFGAIDTGLLLASVIAVELSILVRFVLNDRWTFRERCSQTFLRRLWQSNASSLASPVISLAAVNLLTPVLGISYLVSNSIGIAIGLSWNWVWSSRVVWRQQPASESATNYEGDVSWQR